MATYSEVVSATGPKFSPPAKTVGVVSQTITVGTSDLVLNTLMDIGYVPRGSRVLDVVLSATDMDTNGTPLLVLAVGDSGDDDRFITASTIGQTGGTVRAGNAAGSALTLAAHTQYTADTLLQVKVTAAAATAAAGTIAATVFYEMLEPPV